MRNTPTQTPGFLSTGIPVTSAISADMQDVNYSLGNNPRVGCLNNLNETEKETEMKLQDKIKKDEKCYGKKINNNKKTLKMNLTDSEFKGFASSPEITMDSVPYDVNGMRSVEIQNPTAKIVITETKNGTVFVDINSHIEDTKDGNENFTHTHRTGD